MFRIVIPYKERKNAALTVTRLEEPYGKDSDPVVSVGCTLKGDLDNPSWKIHIPLNLLDETISAMKEVSQESWKTHAE
tara:strand:- start:107 stop:340 length:234 start_codon:yes stop_codon:yes gene_type:complete